MSGPIRVVVADDTYAIRAAVRATLELDGRFEVVGEASNGAEAVQLSLSLKPEAICLDLAMPVMDGLQALPEIRSGSPNTRIVVLSGFDAADMSDEVLRRGADAYLEKGVALREMASLLATLCRHPAIARPSAEPVERRSRTTA